MKTILKYKLRITDRQQIETHDKAEFLALQAQGGIPCMWLLVDTDYPMIKITIYIVGTGTSFPTEKLDYMGTCQIGAFVWHFFEGE